MGQSLKYVNVLFYGFLLNFQKISTTAHSLKERFFKDFYWEIILDKFIASANYYTDCCQKTRIAVLFIVFSEFVFFSSCRDEILPVRSRLTARLRKSFKSRSYVHQKVLITVKISGISAYEIHIREPYSSTHRALSKSLDTNQYPNPSGLKMPRYIEERKKKIYSLHHYRFMIDSNKKIPIFFKS